MRSFATLRTKVISRSKSEAQSDFPTRILESAAGGLLVVKVIVVSNIGSKTWDNFEMRIYKRYIDLECTNDLVKAVTSIKLPSGVDVNVVVNK